MSDTALTSGENIRAEIERSAMSAFQIFAICICWIVNMLDGFDILAIAFTAPEISREWGLMPTELGVVFSASVLGIIAGNLLLAPIGDYIGRRLVILGGLFAITGGMLVTAYVDTVPQMIAARIVTGLGIGAMLASLTSMAAEYSSDRRRNLAISFMQMGYPAGVILGGIVSVYLIGAFGWRSVFVFGGLASAVMIPLVFLLLPESLSYLADKQPNGALKRFNNILRRMGRPSVAALPPKPEKAAGTPITVVALFSRQYLAPTVALWVTFFLCMMTLYFLLSWTPTVVVDAGLSGDQGRLMVILMNIGGGGLQVLLGWLSARFDLKRLIQISLAISAVMIMIFAAVPLPTILLMVFAFLMGFATAGLVGLYSIAARLYPTEMRNTGIGWAIGVGRWGGVFSPIAAGWMIAAGLDRWTYFLALAAAPALIAAIVVTFIRFDHGAGR